MGQNNDKLFDLKKLWQHYESAATKNIRNTNQHHCIPYKTYRSNHNFTSAKKNHKDTKLTSKISSRVSTSTRKLTSNKDKKDSKCKNNSQEWKSFSFKQTNKSTTIQMEVTYMNLMKQIFKMIDTDCNGWIDNQVINQIIIPQKVLYFLGSIFQKIKLTKQKMYEKEFLEKTQQIMTDSTKEDINKFIEQLSWTKIYRKNNTQHQNQQIRQSKVYSKFQIQRQRQRQRTQQSRRIPLGESNMNRQNYQKKQHIKISDQGHKQIQLQIKQQAKLQYNAGNKMPQFIDNKQIRCEWLNNLRQQNSKKGGNQFDDKIDKYNAGNKIPQFIANKERRSEWLNNLGQGNSKKVGNYFDDKIDKLSSRVAQYIKSNANRLAISKEVRQNI